MKKIITILAMIILLASCNGIEPKLHPSEYIVVDTLESFENGFNHIFGYSVIIQLKSDSTYHYGYVTSDGILSQVNIRKINLK